jgi:hypothetical protein
MKTRVIQDDPDEPTSTEDRADGPMKRPPSQEGGLRLAHVRGRALRDQLRLSDEDHRLRAVRRRRVRAATVTRRSAERVRAKEVAAE